MKPPRRSFLSMLDDMVRWTGIPARLAEEMSDAPSVDRKHRPLRWTPILPIAYSGALFILSLIWPSVLDLIPPGATISLLVAFTASIIPMASGIHTDGPLGKPSLEDDEREAALRKDSFLFCLGLLAFLNCLGQPILMVLSYWQNWQTAHNASVVVFTLMLNATLFGCLPTLYASWKLRKLPKE